MTLTAEETAKDLVASYWAIVYELDKHVLQSWMKGREKYGVPLVAKQCAIFHVEGIMNIEGNYLIEKGFWQQVKAALMCL